MLVHLFDYYRMSLMQFFLYRAGSDEYQLALSTEALQASVRNFEVCKSLIHLQYAHYYVPYIACLASFCWSVARAAKAFKLYTTSPFANTTCDCTKTVVTTTAPQTGTITAAMLLQTTEAELDVKLSAAEDDSCDATVFTDILHCISDK